MINGVVAFTHIWPESDFNLFAAVLDAPAEVSDFLKVTITDYRLGIEKKYHKKIFERFYRVDNIQKQYPGMGIGLYVCDQIIKQHGDTLWVESEIGNGAIFNFTIPTSQTQTP